VHDRQPSCPADRPEPPKAGVLGFRNNTVWLAAITYLPTRKIAGWSMRDHMRTELTTASMLLRLAASSSPA
jgi:hypothetical protein